MTVEPSRPWHARQRGAIAVVGVTVLILIAGLFALATDRLGRTAEGVMIGHGLPETRRGTYPRIVVRLADGERASVAVPRHDACATGDIVRLRRAFTVFGDVWRLDAGDDAGPACRRPPLTPRR